MQKISLVIPCYNEAKRFQGPAILQFLTAHPNITLLFVNDGSKDDTEEVIEQLKSSNPLQISALHLTSNSGKAECVRQGMLKMLDSSEHKWFGFWDADMATPLEELDRLFDFASDRTKIILCSRIKRLGASIDRHALRHVLGRVMATLVSLTTGLSMYDYQCGAKLIHRDAVDAAFSEAFLSKWLFDVEILLRLRKLCPHIGSDDTALEVPVLRWRDIPGSKLKFKHFFGALLDIAKISHYYRNSASTINKLNISKEKSENSG